MNLQLEDALHTKLLKEQNYDKEITNHLLRIGLFYLQRQNTNEQIEKTGQFVLSGLDNKLDKISSRDNAKLTELILNNNFERKEQHNEIISILKTKDEVKKIKEKTPLDGFDFEMDVCNYAAELTLDNMLILLEN